MEFRDLKRQYDILKNEINQAVNTVLQSGEYIGGTSVTKLEDTLAEYVGVKNCISCANGTDALVLALNAMDIGRGDAVFIPDFTFFATGEAVLRCGAVPVFVDVCEKTYNMSAESLKQAVIRVKEEKKLHPAAVITVDLFGQPANYREIRKVTEAHGLHIIEDGAQGFGGVMDGKKACSFGDIATTSFFPAKPLGCYGDGGAVFTDNDKYAEIIRSLCVHGKGKDKYDNVRVGMNSRLDAIQAAILEVKFKQFSFFEFERSNRIAEFYCELLTDSVALPEVMGGAVSSWAQYTVRCRDSEQRRQIEEELRKESIPSAIYYRKPMHMQDAFKGVRTDYVECETTCKLCKQVLSLPFHPYMKRDEVAKVTDIVKKVCKA